MALPRLILLPQAVRVLGDEVGDHGPLLLRQPDHPIFEGSRAGDEHARLGVMFVDPGLEHSELESVEGSIPGVVLPADLGDQAALLAGPWLVQQGRS